MSGRTEHERKMEETSDVATSAPDLATHPLVMRRTTARTGREDGTGRDGTGQEQGKARGTTDQDRQEQNGQTGTDARHDKKRRTTDQDRRQMWKFPRF